MFEETHGNVQPGHLRIVDGYGEIPTIIVSVSEGTLTSQRHVGRTLTVKSIVTLTHKIDLVQDIAFVDNDDEGMVV